MAISHKHTQTRSWPKGLEATTAFIKKIKSVGAGHLGQVWR